MKLITKESRRLLPPLYSQENTPGPLHFAKFFTPGGSFTWYAMEFDGEDLCFGCVIGHEAELGYFRISELLRVRGVLGLPVVRDLYFEPLPALPGGMLSVLREYLSPSLRPSPLWWAGTRARTGIVK